MDCAGRLAILLLVVGAGAGVSCGGAGGAVGEPPAPTITQVVPSSAWVDAGTPLAIHGAGFDAGVQGVWIGGVPVDDVQAIDDGICLCTSPTAMLYGPAEVVVETAGGSSATSDMLTYFRWPPRFPASDVRLNSGSPGLASCGEPRLCCDGPNVYVVWQESVLNSHHLYVNRSTDGGLTWLSHDVRIDSDAAILVSPQPRICCQGTNVYVAWIDDRGLARDVYLNRSTDGGATWLTEEVRLVTAPDGAGSSSLPRICCDEARVYVAWIDRRDGAGDVYFNRSLDHGATWLPSDKRLDTDGAGAADSSSVRLCCSGANVYAAWLDFRGGGSAIRFSRSTSSGTSWLLDDVRLDAGGIKHSAPELCCEDDRVYAAWRVVLGGESRVELDRSSDAGSTWLATDVRLDDETGDTDADSPRIACDGEAVHVAWREGPSGDRNVIHNRSLDGGTTWWPEGVRVNTGSPGFGSSIYIELHVSGSNVVLAWGGDAGGHGSFRLDASRDRGAHWLGEDVQPYRTSAAVATPAIGCDGARIHAAWLDFRNGNVLDGRNDVYATSARP